MVLLCLEKKGHVEVTDVFLLISNMMRFHGLCSKPDQPCLNQLNSQSSLPRQPHVESTAAIKTGCQLYVFIIAFGA